MTVTSDKLKIKAALGEDRGGWDPISSKYMKVVIMF